MPDKQRLEQVCKMAELGLMTASLMHEMRQPLWAIKANLQMMMMARSDEDRATFMSRMSDSIGSIERLIAVVVGFAREDGEGVEAMEELSVNAPLQGALDMLEYRLSPNKMVVHRHLSEGLPAVRGSHQGLLQIFLNLLQNSIDALDEVSERHLWVISRLSPGGEIEVLVGDSGKGIAPNVAEQVFEYFFTTKPRGKGTGLGLAISLEIARSHGGVLELLGADHPARRSVNGGGPEPATLFRLILPAMEARRFDAAEPMLLQPAESP